LVIEELALRLAEAPIFRFPGETDARKLLVPELTSLSAGGPTLLMNGAKGILGGVVHDLPFDLQGALEQDLRASATWQDITPLARNEWICWIESAKKAETRRKRIEWGCSNLRDGKRRPCCWPGCPHRKTQKKES
jgi:hypothetical protein